MTTTLAQPTTVRLLERASLSASNVDEQSGVIRGVKILGLHSRNNRRYLPEALRGAIGKYEGIGVFLDHPPRSAPNEGRSYRDKIGTLRRVRFAENALRGDLHINLGHPAAKQLLWDARNNPAAVGLSHNATGRTRTERGVTVVEEITSLVSVDLVVDPASTSGLFESERNYPMSAKEFAERLLEGDSLPAADGFPGGGAPAAETPGGDAELPALQRLILDALEKATSAADLIAKLRSIVDARSASSAAASESYRRRSMRESQMPANGREMAAALLE